MQTTAPKILPTHEALQEEAAHFIHTLTPHKNRATLVTLSGELGAGKTTFTQGIARAFGVEDIVQSPTFVLEKIYRLTGARFSPLVHIDVYRLEGDTSLTPLSFAEAYQDPQTLIVLEWPEHVAGQLPAADVAITLEVLPDATRSITYTHA